MPWSYAWSSRRWLTCPPQPRLMTVTFAPVLPRGRVGRGGGRWRAGRRRGWLGGRGGGGCLFGRLQDRCPRRQGGRSRARLEKLSPGDGVTAIRLRHGHAPFPMDSKDKDSLRSKYTCGPNPSPGKCQAQERGDPAAWLGSPRLDRYGLSAVFAGPACRTLSTQHSGLSTVFLRQFLRRPLHQRRIVDMERAGLLRGLESRRRSG